MTSANPTILIWKHESMKKLYRIQHGSTIIATLDYHILKSTTIEIENEKYYLTTFNRKITDDKNITIAIFKPNLIPIKHRGSLTFESGEKYFLRSSLFKYIDSWSDEKGKQIIKYQGGFSLKKDGTIMIFSPLNLNIKLLAVYGVSEIINVFGSAGI